MPIWFVLKNTATKYLDIYVNIVSQETCIDIINQIKII